jgi:hypothetical protein
MFTRFLNLKINSCGFGAADVIDYKEEEELWFSVAVLVGSWKAPGNFKVIRV